MSERASGAGSVRGTIRVLNFAPKGEVDGLLLDTADGPVQVNIPRGHAHGAVRLVGREVTVEVGPESARPGRPAGGHPVREFLGFRGDGGGEDIPLDPSPDGTGRIEVRGVVARFNYAKHGEPNGVVLDTGDFLHLKPEGMKRAGLRVGQDVTATGVAAPPRVRASAIEAEVVNGVDVRES